MTERESLLHHAPSVRIGVACDTGASTLRSELAARVAALREAGLTHQEVAQRLGISRSYASCLATDPDGAKERARKASYAGTCARCGGPTDGSNGRSRASAHCYPCRKTIEKEAKVWTRDAVLDAIRRYAAEHGRPPSAAQWFTADRGSGYPPSSAVYGNRRTEPFSSWADAIEAAGFPRPEPGHHEVTPESRQRMSEARTVWTPAKIEEALLAFAREHGRLPDRHDAWDGPCYATIRKKIGPLRPLAKKHGLPTPSRWVRARTL